MQGGRSQTGQVQRWVRLFGNDSAPRAHSSASTIHPSTGRRGVKSRTGLPSLASSVAPCPCPPRPTARSSASSETRRKTSLLEGLVVERVLGLRSTVSPCAPWWMGMPRDAACPWGLATPPGGVPCSILQTRVHAGRHGLHHAQQFTSTWYLAPSDDFHGTAKHTCFWRAHPDMSDTARIWI